MMHLRNREHLRNIEIDDKVSLRCFIYFFVKFSICYTKNALYETFLSYINCSVLKIKTQSKNIKKLRPAWIRKNWWPHWCICQLNAQFRSVSLFLETWALYSLWDVWISSLVILSVSKISVANTFMIVEITWSL